MDLREAIRSCGYRQGWVADKLGIGHGHFSEMLSGNKVFPIGRVRQFADLLGVPVGVLIDALTVDHSKSTQITTEDDPHVGSL